jgi:predicted RNA-binding protein YlxR (DUF448 family)
MKDKRILLRVVRSENGVYEVDKTGKSNGRGAYICAEAECFLKAQKTKGFERSFKHKIPKELYADINDVIFDKIDKT